VLGVGDVEHDCALGSDGRGPPVVDVGRRVEPDAGVTVLVVVPTEEPAAVGVRVLEAAEPVGELGAVLEGAELALAERVVVGDAGATVASGDAEVGEQERDGLGRHR
jgi:hypothetical protein